MKMYEFLELKGLYNTISEVKMPLRTTYKFTRLMRYAEEEIAFYQKKFQEIIEEFCEKENGEYKISEDGQSIAIIPEKLEECNQRITELRNLEVPIENIKFTIDELEKIDISISNLNCIMSLIEE